MTTASATSRTSDVQSKLKELVYEYDQRTGTFALANLQDAYTPLARGYSGKGIGYNNPDAEHQKSVGPIPRGVWTILLAVDHPRLGPVSLPLSREEIPYGRSDFLIHGDNRRADRSASSGCIILPLDTRRFIARNLSVVNRLVVYAD